MIIKIVSLFLIGMLVLAMFGRLRLPGPGGKPLNLSKPGKCPHCGRYKLGKGPCPCRKG
ncbi:MAG: hypothetical protein WCD16_14560 [Paracoccaceae bacterium]